MPLALSLLPSLIALIAHPSSPTPRCTSPSDILRQLRSSCDAAIRIAGRFSSAFTWAEPVLQTIQALANYGRGGSAASAIYALQAAAKAAKAVQMRRIEALAHLYAGVLRQSGGHSPEAVVAELRQALQGDLAPSFASRTAHRFLGTKDNRAELRPKWLFGED